VLKSFNDGSGKPPCPVVSLACAAALEPLWPEFDEDWKALLEAHDLKCFHMTDAMTLNGIFSREKGWDEQKVSHLITEIITVLNKHQNRGMQFRCSTVVRADYGRAKKEHTNLRPIPAICANYTVGGLRVPKGEDVILYFDRDEDFLHQVNRVWLKLKKRRAPGWARQTRNILPVDSSHYPIQAADFIAWSMNREQTHGDHPEWAISARLLANGNCEMYGYDRLVEQYANDNWS